MSAHPGAATPSPAGPARVTSLTPTAARAELERPGSTLFLLDVREPQELALAQIAGACAIPMHAVPSRLAEIPRDRPVAVLCHHGIRSWQVASALLAHGWTQVANVAGGIDRWSLEADPRVPRYGRD